MHTVSRVFLLWFSICVSTLNTSCAREQNPYLNRYQGQTLTDKGPQSNANSTGNNSNTNPSTSSNQPPSAAPEGEIPEESLNFTQAVCEQESAYPALATEFAVLCVGGQASEILASLTKNAYNGEGEPQITVIQSDDINQVSHLVYAMSITVPASIEAILAKKDMLANFDITASTGANLTSTITKDIPGDGASFIGGFEASETMTVPAPFIGPIVQSSLKEVKFIDLGKKQIVMNTVLKKQGDPSNNQLASNVLIFYHQEAPKLTRSVIVTFQQAQNMGFHSRAEETGLAMATEQVKNTWSILATSP